MVIQPGFRREVFHWLSLDYSINVFDIMKTAERGCQSLQKQCDTSVYNWFPALQRVGSEVLNVVWSSSATKWASACRLTFSRSTFIHTYCDKHAHKNLIYQDHCAESPFINLNIASNEKYLEHAVRCTRVDIEPFTGSGLISRAFVSPQKLQLSHTVSNLPTLTPPLAFN